MTTMPVFCPPADKSMDSGPGWCGSVDWVLAYELKGQWFYSQSGHMLGLQARSPVGATLEAPYWCIYGMFLSLSFSSPFPLSKLIFLKKSMDSGTELCHFRAVWPLTRDSVSLCLSFLNSNTVIQWHLMQKVRANELIHVKAHRTCLTSI